MSSTKFLGKLAGLFIVLLGLSTLVQRQATLDIWMALLNNQALLYTTGLVCLAGGLAMVLVHNVWSGGALPITVTLVGWLVLIKGLLALLLPSAYAMGAFQVFHYERFLSFYALLLIIFGIYLTYASYKRA
jgi:hypothetical protein